MQQRTVRMVYHWVGTFCDVGTLLQQDWYVSISTVNLYRNIYSGKWKDIMPADLLKLDPRFEIHCNNLSRTLREAKKRVADYKNHGTSKFI